MTKIKDLQFPSYFLTHEVQLNPDLVSSLLNTEINVNSTGNPDSIKLKNGKITISQPSSISKFIFSVLYSLLSKEIRNSEHKDRLSLGLSCACKDYIMSNFKQQYSKHPSVIVSPDKLPLMSVLIRDIVEPLAGKATVPSILFTETSFLDTAKIITTEDEFSREFHIPHRSISIHDYPFIVVNTSVRNTAAQYAHLFCKILELSYGKKKSNNIIKNILLNKNTDILQATISVVKILHGDPGFMVDFLKFVESNVILSNREKNIAAEFCSKCIMSDKYLKDHIKTGQQSNYNPQVFKQWHQWSMIMGLIEKQLGPMRGSMWPATEKLKPTEDVHREMIVERANKKGKNQLNFEELLEVARDFYGHKANQPGLLYETLLKEDRIWKT